MSTYTSLKAHLTDKIERFSAGYELYNSSTEERINYIKKKLILSGLSKYEVELVMSRIIEEKPLKQIVDEQGWTSVSSASHFLRSIFRKLREKGFNL